MPIRDRTGRLGAGLGPWLHQGCGRWVETRRRGRLRARQGPSASTACCSWVGRVARAPLGALQGPSGVTPSIQAFLTVPQGPCRAPGGPLLPAAFRTSKRLAEPLIWAIAFERVLMATELPASSIASDEVSFPRLGCDLSRRMSAFPQDQRRFGPTTRAAARFFWRWLKPLCENRVGELCVWKRPKLQFQYVVDPYRWY